MALKAIHIHHNTTPDVICKYHDRSFPLTVMLKFGIRSQTSSSGIRCNRPLVSSVVTHAVHIQVFYSSFFHEEDSTEQSNFIDMVLGPRSPPHGEAVVSFKWFLFPQELLPGRAGAKVKDMLTLVQDLLSHVGLTLEYVVFKPALPFTCYLHFHLSCWMLCTLKHEGLYCITTLPKVQLLPPYSSNVLEPLYIFTYCATARPVDSLAVFTVKLSNHYKHIIHVMESGVLPFFSDLRQQSTTSSML